MDIQRLRNLTTSILHTKMDDIYEDLGSLVGDLYLMTHMLPRVLEAVNPWLREKITDKRFWDEKYDPSHTGEYNLPTPTKEDRAIFLKRYKEMLNPVARTTSRKKMNNIARDPAQQ